MTLKRSKKWSEAQSGFSSLHPGPAVTWTDERFAPRVRVLYCTLHKSTGTGIWEFLHWMVLHFLLYTETLHSHLFTIFNQSNASTSSLLMAFNYCSFSNKYICVPLPQVDYSPGGPIRSTVLSESLWSNLEQQTSDLRHTLTIWRWPIVLLWLTAVSILHLVVYLHD